MKRPYLQLQLLVLVFAFTAILGRLISLPAPVLVLWRTALSAVIMLAWLLFSKRAPLSLAQADRLRAFGIGVILGLHWITFFGSIQLSNISICLAGMASTSFFTALTEPWFEKRRPKTSEVLLGLLIIPGLCLIAGGAWNHLMGLGCALVSAFLASLFPVLNRRLSLQGIAPQTLTLYEMIGACATCLLFVLASGSSVSGHLPTVGDWFWLVLLAGVCTVWAFTFHIRLLKVFSAFTTNLAINFEPIYGILLAALIFQEHQELSPFFYVGASLILAANLCHALLNREKKHPDSATGEPPIN